MVTLFLGLRGSIVSMRRWPPTLLAAPLLIVLVVLAAGCGGSANSAASVTTTAAASTGTTTTGGAGGGFRGVANTEFTACLKAQGVTLPSGGFRRQGNGASRGSSTTGQPPAGQPRGGGAFNNPKTRAAFEKCRQYLPNGGQFGGANGGRPGVNSAAFAKYRQCLTAHGVKLTGGGAFGGANVASPAFQKAAKACRQYVPQFGQGGGGSPPAGTTP